MIKQLMLALFWVLFCILQLVLSIVEDGPLFFICLFCVLLGVMLAMMIAIILDLTFKDHIITGGRITEIDNKIIRLTLNNQKVRTIAVGKANKQNKFHVNQDILYVESRRSGDFVELREMADTNLKIGGENEIS